MVDTSIKNTGNSRSLRTVANALTLYPTHEAMIAAMVNGTFPIDLGPLNAAGLNTRGTDLNKASLLTDTLCTALGLATTATPTEAMEKLRQLTATAQSTANSANTNANGRAKVETGSLYANIDSSGYNLEFKVQFSFSPQIIVIGFETFSGVVARPFTQIGVTRGNNGYSGSVSWSSYRASFSFSTGGSSRTVYYAGIS